ncbi:unnamed protein product [Gordionus sp. m RMFG-2023]|uniref:BAG family molecular chaperone regulator 1-like isoform X2 n=1 Tax=Gordionus sp. m RMFG-2023 TaxID=3053472 RepID=UPI0030DF84EF
MEIIVQNGLNRIDVMIAPENIETYTLKDLALKLETNTQIPINKQKYIFKGKQLNHMETTLLNYNIKNGNKIMMIGSKGWLDGKMKEESINKLITSLELNIEKCMKLVHQLDAIQISEDFKIAKTMRKMIVDRIMKDLNETDKLIDSVNNIKIEMAEEKKK